MRQRVVRWMSPACWSKRVLRRRTRLDGLQVPVRHATPYDQRCQVTARNRAILGCLATPVVPVQVMAEVTKAPV